MAHFVEQAPVMLISNLCTRAGLVNGAMGTLVGVVLKDGRPDVDIDNAVSAASVKYVVVNIPKHSGPVLFPDHPKWVPIEPTTVVHQRFKGWDRRQVPVVLGWGITIHKSQGLTFKEGCCVDFTHQPTYQPVAQMGLALAGMSRCTA